MFIIIASRYDAAAQAFASYWAKYEIVLLTAEALSIAGWCYYPQNAAASTAVIGGQTVAVDKISGVLTRLSSIPETELPHIVSADRNYVAVEMTAFLLAWLSSLSCTVLNRPSPGCLAGPAWRQAQWVYTAAQLGIPVRPLHQPSTLSTNYSSTFDEDDIITVTVVGERCFGTDNKIYQTQARQLAAKSKTDLLAAHFSKSTTEFMGADLWPDISCPDIAEAVMAYLRQGKPC